MLVQPMIFALFFVLHWVIIGSSSSFDTYLPEQWELWYEEYCDAKESARWRQKQLSSRSDKEKMLDEIRKTLLLYENFAMNVRRNITQKASKLNLGQEKKLLSSRSEDPLKAKKMSYLWITEDPAAIDYKKSVQSKTIQARLDLVYKEMQLCVDKECYTTNPGLIKLMMDSQNPDVRLQWWNKLHTFYPKLQNDFLMSMGLMHEVAYANGFMDIIEQWEWYYNGNMWQDAKRLWNEVKPLYDVIHSWVRMKLKNSTTHVKHGRSAIPAHLLGDIWGKDWSYMLSRRYTLSLSGAELLKTISKKISILGLIDLQQELLSTNELDDSKDGLCKPEVEGFCTGKNISMLTCRTTNWPQLKQLLHVLGKAEWLRLTSHLDFTFREIRKSETPDLYVGLSSILEIIMSAGGNWRDYGKLLNENDALLRVPESFDDNFAFLLEFALATLGTLSYYMCLGSWRRSVFLGAPDHNTAWWDARLRYQGVESANVNEVFDYFDVWDPEAFLITDDFRNFFGIILQFQFFKSLCEDDLLNRTDEGHSLFQCNLLKHQKSGHRIRKAMSLGSSAESKELMEILSGNTRRDASGLLQFFEPLKLKLEEEMNEEDIQIGWELPGPKPKNMNGLIIVGCMVFVMFSFLLLWFFVGRRTRGGR